jgi:hypothetical protein
MNYSFDEWLAAQVAVPIIFMLLGAICFWVARKRKD